MKIGLALDVWYRAPGDYRYKLTEDLQDGDACMMALNPPTTWRLVYKRLTSLLMNHKIWTSIFNFISGKNWSTGLIQWKSRAKKSVACKLKKLMRLKVWIQRFSSLLLK